MITTLGNKHKQAQGWLGNKLHSVRRAGSKVIHSKAKINRLVKLRLL